MNQDLPLPISTNTETKLNTLNNIVAPAAPEDATYGFLYKKTGSDGLFWKTLGGGETNLLTGGANDISSFGSSTVILGGITITTLSNTKGGTNALFTIGDATLAGANTAFGKNALSTIPDSDNITSFTAFGYNAGALVDSGDQSLFIGSFCGQSMAYSSRNVFVGQYVASLSTADDCANNVAVGYGVMSEAGFNGNSSVGIGSEALKMMTTAQNNVGIGYSTGYALTTGSDNTLVGALSGINMTDAIYCTAVGDQALFTNVSTSNLTACGAMSLYLATGEGNAGFGYSSGSQVTDGTGNLFLGNFANTADGTYSSCIIIGYDNRATSNQQLRIGFDNTNAGVLASAYIDGIYGKTINAGTGTAVNVDSTGKLGTVLSSKRYKHDVKLLDGNLVNKVYDLEPVSFIMNDDPDNNINYGLIAEDVRDVMPEMVVYNGNIDIDGKKSVMTVKYGYLAPLLLGAVRQLKARCDVLEARLNA